MAMLKFCQAGQTGLCRGAAAFGAEIAAFRCMQLNRVSVVRGDVILIPPGIGAEFKIFICLKK